MGAEVGGTARVRLSLWACLNHRFSPLQIETTRDRFNEWLADQGIDGEAAIAKGRFYDFAEALGCLEGADFELSKKGWDFFEPGTMGVLSLVVFRNLLGEYITELDLANPLLSPDTKVMNPDSPNLGQPVREVFYPRPMVFERIFGDREEILIRSTKYGIKIVIQSHPLRVVQQRIEARSQFGAEEGFTPT